MYSMKMGNKSYSQKQASRKSSACSKRRNAERGISRITVIVFGILFAIAAYCGFQVGPFYYYAAELENQFKAAIDVASVHTDQEIRQKIMYHVKKLEIPCDPDDLIIERDFDTMRVSLEYSEVFFITFRDKDYEIHTFHFDLDVREKFKG